MPTSTRYHFNIYGNFCLSHFSRKSVQFYRFFAYPVMYTFPLFRLRAGGMSKSCTAKILSAAQLYVVILSHIHFKCRTEIRIQTSRLHGPAPQPGEL